MSNTVLMPDWNDLGQGEIDGDKGETVVGMNLEKETRGK